MIPPTIPTLPFVSESEERLPNDIAEDALRKYFLLTDEDMIEVERCRGSGNRLGFAVQLCALRWRGHFLPDTRMSLLAYARAAGICVEVLIDDKLALPLELPPERSYHPHK